MDVLVRQVPPAHTQFLRDKPKTPIISFLTYAQATDFKRDVTELEHELNIEKSGHKQLMLMLAKLC